MDSVIKVSIFKRQEWEAHKGAGYVRVSLYSIVKEGRKSNYDIELDSVSSEQEMKRAVEIAGGALAEHQNEQLKDNHDPGECAKMSLEAFEEVWAELQQRGIN